MPRSQKPPQTPAQEANKALLIKYYDKAGGNINLTARSIGWSRATTLKRLHAYKLYSKYPHGPGPIAREK